MNRDRPRNGLQRGCHAGGSVPCLGRAAGIIATHAACLVKNPSDPKLLLRLVEACLRTDTLREKFGSIFAQLRKLKLDQRPFVTVSVIGQELVALGLYKASASVLESALRIGSRSLKLRGSVFSALSTAYWGSGKHDQAIACMLQDLAVARSLGDEEGQGRVHGNLGSAYSTRRDHREALQHYRCQLLVAQRLRLPGEAAQALSSLGRVHSALGDFISALASHRQSLLLLGQSEDGQNRARKLGNMGAVFLALGNHDQALQCHQQQLQLALEFSDRVEEARAYSGLGSVHHCRKDFKEAAAFHRRVQDVAMEMGDRTLEARAYAGLGHASSGLQDHLQAKFYHEKQLDNALQTKDKAAEGRACSNLGIIYHKLGEFDAALKLHKVHLQIAKDLGDRVGQGRAYGNIGNAHSALGQFELAVRFHKQELLISQEVGDRQAEASTHGNLGVAYQALELYEQALSHYSSHLSLARDLRDSASEARALSNLGHYHCGRRDWGAALPLYSQYLDLSQELQDVGGEGRACHRLGYIHQRLGNHREAVRYYTQDLALARELQDHGSLCRAYCNLGLAHRALGELDKALQSHKYCLAAALMCKDADAQFLALGNIGDILCQTDDAEEALKMFYQQLVLARRSSTRKHEAAALANLGSIHKKLSQFDKALGYYNQELTVLQEINDVLGECKTHGNLGNIHVSLRKYGDACRCYQEQLDRSRDLKDSSLEAHTYGNLGITKMNMGCFSEAIGHFESQLAMLEQTSGAESLRARGQAYRHLASCYESLADFPEAIDSYEHYLTLSQSTGSVADQEAAYRGLGHAHRALGNLQQALVCLEKRLVAAHELQDPDARSAAYGELGCLHSLLGNFEQALSCLGHQLRAARDLGDRAAEGEAACGLGGVYQQMADYERALEFHSLDQTIADQLHKDSCKCRASGNLGLCHESLGNFEQALQHQERHLAIATETNDDTEKTLAYSSLGRIHHAVGRYAEAVRCLEAGLQIAEPIGRVEDEARIRHRLGLSLWGLGDLNAAQQQLYSAIDLFESIRREARSNSEYKLSLFDLQTASYQALQRVLVSLGRSDDALVVAERGRTRAFVDLLLERQTAGEESSALDGSPVSLEQMTDTVSRQRVAVLYYSMAAGFLYSWLLLPDRGVVKFHESALGEPEVSSDPEDAQSLKSFRSISTSAMSLLDSYVGQARETLGVESHLSSSRLSLSGGGGSLSETESDADDLWQRHLEEVGEQINAENDHTGFLRMERRDHVWNASSYSLGSVLSLPSGLLGPRAGSVYSRASTRSRVSSHSALPPGRPALAALYDLLVGPMEDALPPLAGHQGCRELVLVLQGDLYLVPFPVLRPSQTASPLYERYNLLTTPSLRALRASHLPSRHAPYSPECTGAVVVGNPKLPQSVASAWQWGSLPATELECRTVAEMMGCRSMMGASATKDNVLKDIPHAELIHFATHVSWKLAAIILSASNFSTTSSVRGDLERMDLNDTGSELSLSLDGPPLCEFLLTAADLLNLRLHARLVVLSSGHSEDRAGRINTDGVVGLTRALLAAGAQCVMFALWPVPEMAARVLMRSFYTALLQGARASQALSAALKSLQSSRQFSHPSNWACWMLVGTDVRLSSKVALMGHSLCRLLRSPAQSREAMRVILHLVEKSLQRMQQGQRKSMYTTQQSIENKVGGSQGWRDLLTSVGFRLEPSTNDLPAAVFFPTFDPGERLTQCSASLQALLGLSTPTLTALSQMVDSPDVGEMIINLVREASSRLGPVHGPAGSGGGVEVPVGVRLWRTSGVHEFLASLGFDLVEVGKDEVTLKIGKNANRRMLQFGLQSLMAVFDTAAAPRALLMDSSSSMESLCSSGSSSQSKGSSPPASPTARKRSFFNPAEVEKLPSAKSRQSPQTGSSRPSTRSDLTLHLDRQNIIREKYSSPSGSELSDTADLPRIISVDTDSRPEAWVRPVSRRAQDWMESSLSLDGRPTSRRSQRSVSASRTRSRSERVRGPVYSSSSSDSEDGAETSLSRAKSRSSQSLTSLASTLTLRSTASAPGGLRRNRSRASLGSTRSSASDRTLTGDSRHGSRETLGETTRTEVAPHTPTDHLSDSGIHSKHDTATDNSADTDGLEHRLKSRPQNRRRERSLSREEYKLDDGALRVVTHSRKTGQKSEPHRELSKPPSGRNMELMKPSAGVRNEIVSRPNDPATVTHKVLAETDQQRAALEQVQFWSVQAMKDTWESGKSTHSVNTENNCQPPGKSDPKPFEPERSSNDDQNTVASSSSTEVQQIKVDTERERLLLKHKLLLSSSTRPKPRPILANSLTDAAASYTCGPGEQVSLLRKSNSQSELDSEPDVSQSELESEPELSVIEEESETVSDANTSFGPESELSMRLAVLRMDRRTPGGPSLSPGPAGDRTLCAEDLKTPQQSPTPIVARRKSVTFQEEVQTEIISEAEGEQPEWGSHSVSVSPPIGYKAPPPYPAHLRRGTEGSNNPTGCWPSRRPATHKSTPGDTARILAFDGDLNTPHNLQRMSRHFYQGGASESFRIADSSRTTADYPHRPTLAAASKQQYIISHEVNHRATVPTQSQNSPYPTVSQQQPLPAKRYHSPTQQPLRNLNKTFQPHPQNHRPETHQPHPQNHRPETHQPHPQNHRPETHQPHPQNHRPETHQPHPQNHRPETHQPHPQNHRPETHQPHPQNHRPETHQPHPQTHQPHPQNHRPETHQPHPQNHRPETHLPHPQNHRPETHQPHPQTHQPHPQNHRPETHQPHPQTHRPQTHQPHPQNHHQSLTQNQMVCPSRGGQSVDYNQLQAPGLEHTGSPRHQPGSFTALTNRRHPNIQPLNSSPQPDRPAPCQQPSHHGYHSSHQVTVLGAQPVLRPQDSVVRGAFPQGLSPQTALSPGAQPLLRPQDMVVRGTFPQGLSPRTALSPGAHTRSPEDPALVQASEC